MSIANYLGVPTKELVANYKLDTRLHEEIESTCALVRDYSIKELVNSNPDARKIIKDICYGNGFVMVEGKLEQSGACNLGQANKELKLV